MTDINRRNFIKGLGIGAGALAVGFPSLILGATTGRVVIVGGGTGGASVGKYLKRADSNIDVTIIEPNAIYHTCYGSNEVISGERAIGGIQADYTGLSADGITVVQDSVTAIDPVKRTITTENGSNFDYDRCVVSPGIDFKWETIEGYDKSVSERIPHAWKAGEQTTTLRNQLQAMDDGGTVIIAPPDNPFRCPPGPYERISQVAHYLKNNKPSSKVLVLDAKGAFSKQAAFEQGWEKLYGYGEGGMIEWAPSDRVVQVAENTKTVTTANGFSYTGDVINIIPNQKANGIAHTADLSDGDWCPVDMLTFESTRHPGIHVIGDASVATPLPKSGFSANAEAKACANAIAALLKGNEIPNPVFTNTCYSVVGEDYGISVVAMYRMSADGTAIEKISDAGGVTSLTASADDLRREVGYAHGWYNNFVDDVFG